MAYYSIPDSPQALCLFSIRSVHKQDHIYIKPFNEADDPGQTCNNLRKKSAGSSLDTHTTSTTPITFRSPKSNGQNAQICSPPPGDRQDPQKSWLCASISYIRHPTSFQEKKPPCNADETTNGKLHLLKKQAQSQARQTRGSKGPRKEKARKSFVLLVMARD